MSLRTASSLYAVKKPQGSSGPFEPALLPIAEKERLCRDLLSEFDLAVHTHAEHRHELIIPCRVSPRHKNQDREPTAALNYEKLTFKCLGCGVAGGLLWFIATHRGTSGTEARDWLGKETGTGGNVMDLTALARFIDALYATKATKPPMQTYPANFLEPWSGIHPWVTDPPEYNGAGRNVGGWGVPLETAEKMHVGYAPEYFMGKGRPTSERIVIPHFWRGNLVGWQSRRIANDGTPKYKSSPEFPKDETIFNYAPREHDVAVVVESPKSALRHLHHIHVVATFGKDVTETQIKLLSKYKRLIWWFDNDPGGWEAYTPLTDNRGKVTKVSTVEAVARFTDTWTVQSPYAQDPAEIGDDEVERMVAEHAVPWSIWQMPSRLVCVRCQRTAHEGGCS